MPCFPIINYAALNIYMYVYGSSFLTNVGGRRTEDGRRRTEVGGQRSVDGGHRMEDGRRTTEGGLRPIGAYAPVGSRGTEGVPVEHPEGARFNWAVGILGTSYWNIG